MVCHLFVFFPLRFDLAIQFSFKIKWRIDAAVMNKSIEHTWCVVLVYVNNWLTNLNMIWRVICFFLFLFIFFFFLLCILFVWHFCFISNWKNGCPLVPANKQPYNIKIMEFFANKINCIIHMSYSNSLMYGHFCYFLPLFFLLLLRVIELRLMNRNYEFQTNVQNRIQKISFFGPNANWISINLETLSLSITHFYN